MFRVRTFDPSTGLRTVHTVPDEPSARCIAHRHLESLGVLVAAIVPGTDEQPLVWRSVYAPTSTLQAELARIERV